MMILDGMLIYLEIQILSVPPMMMTWSMKVGLYMFLSDGNMYHRIRYRDRFGFRVDISGNTAVIGAGGDKIYRGSNRGYGYM